MVRQAEQDVMDLDLGLGGGAILVDLDGQQALVGWELSCDRSAGSTSETDTPIQNAGGRAAPGPSSPGPRLNLDHDFLATT